MGWPGPTTHRQFRAWQKWVTKDLELVKKKKGLSREEYIQFIKDMWGVRIGCPPP